MNKWGEIVVDEIDNNGPRHYHLDDKKTLPSTQRKKKAIRLVSIRELLTLKLYKKIQEHCI